MSSLSSVECSSCSSTSTSTSISSLQQIEDVPQTTGVSLRRKRIAAAHLPRITLNSNIETQQNDNKNDTFLNVSQIECVQDDDIDQKRQRVSESSSQQSDQFSLDIVEGQSRSPYGSSDRDESPKSYCIWPNVNNTVICGYQLVGAGKEFTAFHLETKNVKTCQLIDNEQYQKVLKVKERLNEAKKYWKHSDLDEMREFVLPSCIEICQDEQGRRFMFSPWQYGTLHGKVQSGRCGIPETDVQPLFVQIVKGIAFCHAVGIVVRDLKLRKFIFTDKNMTRLRLHDVFDVFLCSDITDDGMRDRHSCPAYVAPEILTKGPAEYAGRPADIWALGVLLYVLLFGSYPFNDATPQRLFSRIFKVRFCMPPQASVSQAARSLIYGMLRKEPNERPTAEDLLFVPWLAVRPDNLWKLNGITRTTPVHVITTGTVIQPPSIASLTATVVPGVRIASAVTTVTPSVQLHRILSGNSTEDDQVVPAVSASVLALQRQLKCLKSLFTSANHLRDTTESLLLSSTTTTSSTLSTTNRRLENNN